MSLTGKKCDDGEPHLQHEWGVAQREWGVVCSLYWCAGTRIREVREEGLTDAEPAAAARQDPS